MGQMAQRKPPAVAYLRTSSATNVGTDKDGEKFTQTRLVTLAQKSNGGFNMANDLLQLRPHIDQMRTTLLQTAEAERTLVQSLSDALKRMDQETLRSVRNVSAEHEARRAGILNELQALAASIGTFHSPRE
jgi:hypothetical protein